MPGVMHYIKPPVYRHTLCGRLVYDLPKEDRLTYDKGETTCADCTFQIEFIRKRNQTIAEKYLNSER